MMKRGSKYKWQFINLRHLSTPITKQKFWSIPSFTVFEMLITLAVSGILMTAVFYSYLSIQKLNRNFIKHTEDITELTQFSSVFLREFRSAPIVKKAGDKLMLEFYNTNKNTVYNFVSKEIIRESSTMIDTFQLKVENLSVDYLDNLSKTVKSLNMKIRFKGTIIPVHITKEF